MSSEHQGVWTLLQRFGFDPEEAEEDVQAIVRGFPPADSFVVGFLVGAQVREERDGVSA